MGRKDKPIISDNTAGPSIGARMRKARQAKGISLTEMAKLIGCTKALLSGAENGLTRPSQGLLREYERILQTHELREAAHPEHPTQNPPDPWIVPYPRNPFFTGREALLQYIHTILNKAQTAAVSQPQAISGLGGIGKTQLVLEFAYRYSAEYQHVLWVNAATRETLNADYLTLVQILDLPEKNDHEQSQVVMGVKKWLASQKAYLLIMDNADTLALVKEFLPLKTTGHILLTTRAQAMGRLAQRVEIETMGLEEGMLFVLRRAGLLVPSLSLADISQALCDAAKELVQEMGGLPLALDQAGAYIEETGCSIHDYLQRYQHHRMALLKRRGGLIHDHPEPVATTWNISFQQVETAHPLVSDLMYFCAFLAPDAIPEEFIGESAAEMDTSMQPLVHDLVALDSAIEVLRRFSLVKRDPSTRTLSLHRLVQAVLRDTLSEEMQRIWAERVVHALDNALYTKSENILDIRQRYLPHILQGTILIAQGNMQFYEAARLLSQTGKILSDQAEYEEAEPLLQRALLIYEQILGPEHPDTVKSLNNLAQLYQTQSRYEEAEVLWQRALSIHKHLWGPDHPDTALALSHLALLYQHQGRYQEAEPILVQALNIIESALGTEHSNVATPLHSLARLYHFQGRYSEAEPLYKHTLAIQSNTIGAEHLDTAVTLNNLARLYHVLGRLHDAETLFLRALAIQEKVHGPDHPHTATSLHNLAGIYQDQERYQEAEALLLRAITIKENMLGKHPSTAASFNALAYLYYIQNRHEEAERLFQRAVAMKESILGEHPITATTLNDLARLYHAQGRYEEAEPLFRRALLIEEKAFGPEHPDIGSILRNLAELYYDQGYFDEAELLFQRASAIKENTSGSEYP